MPGLLSTLVLAANLQTSCLVKVRDILSHFTPEHTTNVTFRLHGQVTSICRSGFIFADSSGRIYIINKSGRQYKKGDTIDASGYVEFSENGDIYPFCQGGRLVSHGEPEPLTTVSLEQVLAGEHDFRDVRTRGTVIDSFKDELDDRWNWFRLSDGRRELMSALSDRILPAKELDELIGSEIEVDGTVFTRSNGTRSFLKRHLILASNANIKVVKRGDPNPFDEAKDCLYLLQDPVGHDFDSHREYRARGEVVATWKKSRICLRIGPNKIVRVQLRRGLRPPACGALVTIVGFVRRGLFFSTIVNARCRIDGKSDKEESPTDVSAKTIFQTASRNWSANAFYDGHLVTTTASVRNISNSGSADGQLLVSADGHDFTVQIGTLSPPPIGSTITVTGICLMTTEQDPNGMDFERMNGVMIVPRSANDIRIVSMPPWLTPGRLLGAIAALLIAIGIILAWTAHLKRVIARRGRELADEQIQRAETAFKVEERTRLAVEIHDSLSQTLSALSMQLGAIRRFADSDREKMLNRISLASKSLKSCRDELKNCLWDLRSDTLEEKSLDTAIRRTLSQHITDTTDLKLRFSVPREKLTDNTTHILLSIIRELVVNAIHHGNATSIRIAGALESGDLKFSVSDDGCGFDTVHAPGIAEGHFGLQGIRERIENLGGTLSIESAPGTGTRVTARINLPHQLTEK